MSFKKETKLEIFFHKNFPLIFSLLVIIISYAPIHIHGLFYVKPSLVYILIYCWGVNYCDDFSYGGVVCCGLLEDLLGASFFGANSLCYILFYHFTVTNRKYIAWKDFRYSWTGFALLSLPALTLKWVLVSLKSSAIIDFGPTFFSWMILCLLFPLLFLTSFKLYEKVLGVHK